MMFKVASALALTSGFIGQSSTKFLMPWRNTLSKAVALALFVFLALGLDNPLPSDHRHNQNMVLVVRWRTAVLLCKVWVLVGLLVLPFR